MVKLVSRKQSNKIIIFLIIVLISFGLYTTDANVGIWDAFTNTTFIKLAFTKQVKWNLDTLQLRILFLQRLLDSTKNSITSIQDSVARITDIKNVAGLIDSNRVTSWGNPIMEYKLHYADYDSRLIHGTCVVTNGTGTGDSTQVLFNGSQTGFLITSYSKLNRFVIASAITGGGGQSSSFDVVPVFGSSDSLMLHFNISKRGNGGSQTYHLTAYKQSYNNGINPTIGQGLCILDQLLSNTYFPTLGTSVQLRIVLDIKRERNV